MNKITEQHFSFKCPMDFEAMELSGSGRHCAKCQKHVFDLTDCSIDEVIALQLKHGTICGSIRVAHLAAIALSLSAAACSTKSESPGPVYCSSKAGVTGGVEVCPSFVLIKSKNAH